MELTKLTSLISLLRASGVTSYRDGDFELTLGAAPGNGGEDSATENLEDDDGLDRDGLSALPEPYRRAFGVSRG